MDIKIIVTIIVIMIEIIVIFTIMMIGLQATLRGQSQVCRSWLYTNPPETIDHNARHQVIKEMYRNFNEVRKKICPISRLSFVFFQPVHDSSRGPPKTHT